MRKKFYIIFSLLISFFCINDVFAAEQQCMYEPSNKNDVADRIDLIFMYDLKDGKITSYNGFKTYATGTYNEPFVIDQDKDPNFLKTMYKKIGASTREKLRCPQKITACKADDNDLLGINNEIIVAIHADYTNFLGKGNTYTNSDGNKYEMDVCRDYFYIEKYFNVESSFEKADSSEFNECNSLTDMINSANNLFKEKNIAKYKVEKEKIINVCNFHLSSRNYLYDNDKGIIDACVDTCLKLDEILIEATETPVGECGISENLGIWIGNIVRWIKYIIPVAVIVLGIIDFIKAMAGDKDDEMKKAQGRFVKRLIAAALIFLVPILVEFVLDKMGLLVNDCGIIDL